MTEIHHTILVGKKPVPLILKLAENSITLTAHLHAVSPGDRLGSVTLSGDGSSLDLATTQFTNDYRGEIKSVTPFADLEHPGRIPEQNTLIEIDLEGGLVQEVRTNQPGASVLVIDYDALEVGEDPRMTLAAEFDPTLAPSGEFESPEHEHLNDDEILERAAQITKARHAARLAEDQAEVKRLYKRYGKVLKVEHDLGKPNKLSMVEALLVAALERTRYVVSAECPNGNRWHGDASCTYGLQETVIVVMQDSRLELLWELWRNVSGQPVGHVTLTEDHLQGSVCHQHHSPRSVRGRCLRMR